MSEIRDTEVIVKNTTLSQDTCDIGLFFKFQEVC